MKRVKIFLLDLNPENGLGSTLRGILEPALSVDDTLNYKSLALCESIDSTLSTIIPPYNPDILFLALSRAQLDQSKSLLESVRSLKSKLPVIVLMDECEPKQLVALLRYGAVDFLSPPLKAIDIFPRIWRLVESVEQKNALTQSLKEKLGLGKLIGESDVFRAVIKKIPLTAKCNATVLISGETGTGKELCARAVHYLGSRADKSFVPVNCGATPVELMENELFGHVRSAFTGATSSTSGLIQEADGGTLFLDDIDSLSLSAQVKLLRFLQEKEYRQLGSSKMCQADVRIIAATNLDLAEAVRKGTFRQDLYYRLNIIPLTLPPLRQRQGDLPLLARHFLKKYAAAFEKNVTGFSPEAVQKLLCYNWPGNVRELECVVERTVLLCEQDSIKAYEIDVPRYEDNESWTSFKDTKARYIARFERDYIQNLLCVHQGNITKAAAAADKNRRAFWQLIRKHEIDIKRFKAG